MLNWTTIPSMSKPCARKSSDKTIELRHCDWIELFRIGRIVQTRQAQPWIQPEFLFQLHPMSKKQQQCLDILHGFTDKVNI